MSSPDLPLFQAPVFVKYNCETLQSCHKKKEKDLCTCAYKAMVIIFDFKRTYRCYNVHHIVAWAFHEQFMITFVTLFFFLE